MKLSSFPYPGNKSSHVYWIAQHIPEHERYVEPFCGSASLFFNKIPSKHAILNDIDENIINFFEALRDKPEELVREIELTPFSSVLHRKIVESYYKGEYPQDPVKRAAEFYFLRYAQFGAKIEGDSGFARSKGKIYSRAKTYKNSTRKLRALSDRLKDAIIECESYDWIIEHYDHPDALFYLDPPYMGTEGRYTSKTMDHKELLTQLNSLDGKFILSYDHELEDSDFHRVEKDSRYLINRGGSPMTEYLYMNFDPQEVTLQKPGSQMSISSEAWE